MDFCAINVVVYTPGGKHWALTEWPRAAVQRHPDHIVIGPNAMGWQGEQLVVRFDERSAPFGGRLRGELRLTPARLFGTTFDLDAAARHHWWPIAPTARVELRLEQPALQFVGSGYHDSNFGDEPLEAAFASWNWSRAELTRGTAILYDLERRADGPLRLGRLFGRDGTITAIDPPQQVVLPRGLWREPRATRADHGAVVQVEKTLETSPFYARSLLRSQLAGEPCLAMHEALSLTRFDQGWVQFLLPFKTRRRSRPW